MYKLCQFLKKDESYLIKEHSTLPGTHFNSITGPQHTTCCSLTLKVKQNHVAHHIIDKELVKLLTINWKVALAYSKYVLILVNCGNPDISQYIFFSSI
jgi:hypothetical protein